VLRTVVKYRATTFGEAVFQLIGRRFNIVGIAADLGLAQ
jgi:hypothetical protein